MNVKNIKLLYIIAFLNRTWFWLGIWVFFYLRFTDYAGIGLLETVMIATITGMEIPTGAIADLLGKKKTLIVSFLLSSAGSLIMAFSPSYGYLLVSVVIMSTGTALYSGTAEALAYDSLKEHKQEKLFDRVISYIKSIQLIAFAGASAAGGFMYSIFPGMPFMATGIALIFALVLTFFLKEPSIDTQKFSWNNFIYQNKQGLHQLFKLKYIKQQTILLLVVGLFIYIAYEVLNDILGVEFGFNPRQLGILWSVLALAAAGASLMAPRLRALLGSRSVFFWIGIAIAVTLVVSPMAGMILGGLSLFVRASLQAVYENMASVLINKHTESKFRATTLSTFNLLVNLPYVASAYAIGYSMDIISGKNFAFVLGVLLIIMLVVFFIKMIKLSKA